MMKGRKTTVFITIEMDTPVKRRSYSREKKIEILAFYNSCKNQCQTCNKFGLDTRTLMCIVKKEEILVQSVKGSKKMGSRRRAFYPDMENELVVLRSLNRSVLED